MQYDAFVSYSHAADGKLAPRLQSALQRFAKPWYRLRALRVFRDQTSLSVTPALWPSIEAALGGSDHFLLLASPKAACSPWVQREVAYWLQHKSSETLLIVVTDGTVAWDHAAGDFDWVRTDALPLNLKGAFPADPLWVDLRWAKGEEQLSAKDPRFQDAVASVAATLHGRPKEDLIGEEVRQHERARRLASAAIAALMILLIIALWQRREAEVQRDEAKTQARVALSRQLAAEALTERNGNLDLALLLSVQANRTSDTFESRRSLREMLGASPHLTMILHHDGGPVSSVALSPDGTRLASGGRAGLRLWDVASGNLLGAMDGGVDGQRVADVAFVSDQTVVTRTCPDGGQGLVVCEGELQFWDVASHRSLGPPLEGHPSGETTMAVDHSGKLMASAGRTETGSTVILWDVATQQPRVEFPVAQQGVMSLAFDPEGIILAVGGGDHSLAFGGDGITLVDVATGRQIGYNHLDHQHGVRALAFSPEGNSMASGSTDGVILWNVTDPSRPQAHRLTQRTMVGTPAPNEGDPFGESLAFSRDGTMLVSGGIAGSLQLWDVGTRQPAPEPIRGHASMVTSVVFGPDGLTMASGGADGRVILWDVQDAQPLATTLKGAGGLLQGVAFNQTGSMVAAEGKDGAVALWDAATGAIIGRVGDEVEDSVKSVAFGAGTTLAVAGKSGVELRDAVTGQLLGEPILGSAAADRLAFSSDGTRLAIGNADGSIILWDLPTQRALATTPAGGTGAPVLAFSPNGGLLAEAVGFDRKVVLRDAVTLQRIGEILSPDASMQEASSLAFSPDGKTLAVGWANLANHLAAGEVGSSLVLWDVGTQKPLGRPLTGLGGYVSALAFDPDGRSLVSISAYGYMLIWDLRTRQSFQVSPMDVNSFVHSAAVSPDGGTVVTAGDALVRWDLHIESWRDRACAEAHRNLDKDSEWPLFMGDQQRYAPTCPDLPILTHGPNGTPADGTAGVAGSPLPLPSSIAASMVPSRHGANEIPATAATPALAARPVGTPSYVTPNDYTSPIYGFSLAWDPAWKLEEVKSGTAGSEILRFGNGLSDVLLEAGSAHRDVAACLPAAADLEQQYPTWSDVTSVTNADGVPLQGGDASYQQAVYTYTQESGDGARSERIAYVECRTLVAGQSGLFVIWTVARAAYNGQAPLVETLLSSLQVSSPGRGAGPPSGGSAIATVPRLDPSPVSAASSGLEGSTYRSPHYGYGLAWNRPWSAKGATSVDGVDSLEITNGTSSIYVVGYADPKLDLQGCQQTVLDAVVGDDTSITIKVMRGPDGQRIQGRDVVGAYVVFRLEGEGDDPLALYVACRSITPGGGMLRVVHLTSVADYYEQARAREELLGGLTFQQVPASSTSAAPRS